MTRTVTERNRLVEGHLQMVYAIAHQVAARTPQYVEFGDLAIFSERTQLNAGRNPVFTGPLDLLKSIARLNHGAMLGP